MEKCFVVHLPISRSGFVQLVFIALKSGTISLPIKLKLQAMDEVFGC